MVNETCFSSKRPGQFYPSTPIHSASGVGVGFRYLNTFSQGIWSTRATSRFLEKRIQEFNWVLFDCIYIFNMFLLFKMFFDVFLFYHSYAYNSV